MTEQKMQETIQVCVIVALCVVVLMAIGGTVAFLSMPKFS